MLKDWRIALFFALCAFFAIWILWWGSLGFILTHPICGDEKSANDCASYNVISYSAWQLAKAADHWGVLITALATIAIAFFTLTLKRSTDRLWDGGERQLIHLRQSSERELRAYVLISGGKIANIDNRDGRKAEISIRNFGKTPAHDLKFWVAAGVREFPLCSALEDAPPTLKISSDVLPPSRPSVMMVPVASTNMLEEEGLKNNTAAIYVYGQIVYFDAFNNRRVTDFRHMCFGEGLPTGQMSPCEEGNKYT